jgi:predicted TPR repeat methyltransferase
MLEAAQRLHASGAMDQAEAAYRGILAHQPDSVPALNQLAALLEQTGRLEESSLLYCRAFVQPPLQGKSHKMLGIAYYRLGWIEQAAQCYRDWLVEEPDQPIALHHLAACGGAQVPGRAADRYVVQVFDALADEFDRKLVDSLGYRGPAIIDELLRGCVPCGAALEVLDAGCGTGLCASVLAPFARRLTGVDLSKAMLDKARARDRYHELVQAELTDFLRGCVARYDLVVMADTLIYFGEVGPLFDALARAVRPGGWLALTAERASGPVGIAPGFELAPSGRYAHDLDYLTARLNQSRFALQRRAEVVLRTEFCRPIAGLAMLAASADQ